MLDYVKLPAIDVLKQIYLSKYHRQILSIKETLRTTENSSFRLYFYGTVLYNFYQFFKNYFRHFHFKHFLKIFQNQICFEIFYEQNVKK